LHFIIGTTLLKQVWYHWNRKSQQEVIDPYLDYKIHSYEQIMRCIQIGLLCIQHIAAKRPDMLQVLDMLNSKKPLPAPSIPGFLHRGYTHLNESGFFKSVLRLKKWFYYYCKISRYKSFQFRFFLYKETSYILGIWNRSNYLVVNVNVA
jgi:hypothetical protein